MVLVTLGGCHILDGLVVLRRSDCEGDCAHPAGAAKSNFSRETRRVTSGPVGSSARACGKHSTWESVTCGSSLARGPAATLELVSTGT